MASYSYKDDQGKQQTVSGADANAAFASIQQKPKGLTAGSLETSTTQPIPSNIPEPTPAVASSTGKAPVSTAPSASTSAPSATQASTVGPSSYTVAAGDNLTTIAQKYGTNIQALMKENPSITNPNQINAGSKIQLPGSTPITTSPTPLGQASKAIYAAVSAVPDQSDSGAVAGAASSATANLGAEDPNSAMLAPFIASSMAAVQAIMAPGPTYQSLTDEYSQLSASTGLTSLNTQLMNLGNIMNGTPDDIRNEITASGGFADDSQVQAMATSRNTVLLKQYNALQSQQAAAQDYVTNTMQYEEADQQERDNQQNLNLTKINDAAGITQNLATLEQTMQKNAQGNYQSIISALPNGVAGLAQLLAGSPEQLGYAEQTLGLPAGSLSDPTKINQINQQYQAAALQKEANTVYTNTGSYPSWYNPITGQAIPGTTVNPDGTISGGDSGSGTVVGGIDFGNVPGVGEYATDVDSEVSGVSRAYDALSSGTMSIGQYITNNAPDSPVTENMITSAATQNNIDPNILAATLANESNFGTAGAGAKTNNPGNVGNTDDGSTKTFDSVQDGVNAAAEQLARRKATAPSDSSDQNSQVQAYVAAYQAGAITSLSTVPKGIRAQVAAAIGGTGPSTTDGSSTADYSPLAVNRFTRAANAIVANYIALPQYQLTANGLPYLQRIAAAEQNPGSVSDQDLLDSLTKLNSSGNAISDAQVKIITDGKSFSDAANVFSNKLANGGVLSDDQRQQIQKIATAVYDNYKQGYQPVYDQATAQLKASGIPEAFWTIPDLNKLNDAQTGNSGTGKGTQSDSAFVESSLDAQGLKYSDVTTQAPKGEIPVLDNSTGELGYIPESEYDASAYTRV